MHLVTYYRQGETRTGALIGDFVVDLNRAYRLLLRHHESHDELAVADVRLPTNMIGLLAAGEPALAATRQIDAHFAGRLEEHADHFAAHGLAFPRQQVALRAPVLRPGKVICLGLNYRAHADEAGFPYPAYPVLFHKAATSLIGDGEAIQIPAGAERVDFEGELAVIIGRRGKNIPEARALTHVAGYACANDVSERAWQFRTPQWTTGKMIDTFCPLGPALVTSDEVPDPNRLQLTLRLNDVVMQAAGTEDMIFDVAFTISYISTICTLEPGDVILTGTPSGIGNTRDPQVFMQPGDTVSVTISRLGTLTNSVAGPG